MFNTSSLDVLTYPLAREALLDIARLGSFFRVQRRWNSFIRNIVWHLDL